MSKIPVFLALVIHAVLPGQASAAGDGENDAYVARGRYLVSVSGCNDCHTPGYMQVDGQVDEKHWLVGTSIGFKGAWGTSYASNLRLLAAKLDEQAWLARTQLRMLPPMPWFALQRMTEDDRRAIYRYLRHLGPAGTPAPLYVLPGHTPSTPFIVFEPIAPSPHGAPLASAGLE